MEGVQGPFSDAHAPAFTSFDRVGVLIPLAERAAADLLAASACQTERIRKLLESITALTEIFRNFESEQALRNHPAIQHEWLLRMADFMHVTRQALFDVSWTFGLKERKLQYLSEELEGFQADCLDIARRLLPEATYRNMFQPAQPLPARHERRSSLRRETEAFATAKGHSALEEDGTELKWLKNEVIRLCMRVTALEEQLQVKQAESSGVKVGVGQRENSEKTTEKQTTPPPSKEPFTGQSTSPESEDDAVVSGAENSRTAGSGPEIFVSQIPPGLPPEIIQSRLQSAFSDVFSGFDALPRDTLGVRRVRSLVEARSGETVAYVGMTSLLAAEVVMDASARAPLRAVAAIRTLRDQEGIAHKIRIPARQNWAPAPGARAEIEALRALQDMLRAWDPRRCAYARARSAHGDLCALVREKVRAYAGAPAWELEVLTVGHHAFARFSSAAAADEFFDRPRSRFESEWDPELFICRHRGFIPMPGYYSGAPIQTLKPQQVSVLPPEAKPPPTPKTPTLPRREAPDFAGAWSYDLYVAETADRARPRSASARAETGPEYRDGAVLKEEELFESREGGERTEGTLRLRSETQRRPAAGLGNGSRAGTRRGSDASVSASDVSSAEVLVGGRREGPVAQWGRQLPQPFGFEEEIVPPSSISKATVRVRSEGRDKKTPEMRNAVTGGAFTRGTGDEIAKHKVTGGAFTGGTGGEPAEQKAAGGPASSDTSGVKIKSESRLQATDGETDLEPDEESDGVIRFDAYEDEFDDSVEGRIDGFGASWAVEPMEPSFDIPDGFETERDGVRTGGSWGEVDRPRSVVWNKEPGTKTQGASPGTGFPPGARQFQSTCTNGASTERSVQLAMAQSVEPTGEAAGKAAAGPPCKPGTAQKRVYAPLQFELSPELLQEGLGPSAWR